MWIKGGGAINLIMPLISDIVSNENESWVATGMSFGVDSFYTYYTHIGQECPKSMRINTLTFFNHGANNNDYKASEEEIRRNFLIGKKRAYEFAINEGQRFISVDCNLNEVISTNYTLSHTYRTVALLLLFQREVKHYYYASGGDNTDVVKIDLSCDSADYDFILLPQLSTTCTTFYSDAVVNRFEKTKAIAEKEKVKTSLTVCWRAMDNCSACPKCIRTMATLELLGELEEYKNIFDLKVWKDRYVWNWAKIISLRKKDLFYAEIYHEAKKQKKRFGIKIRLLSILFILLRVCLPKGFLSKLQSLLKKK